MRNIVIALTILTILAAGYFYFTNSNKKPSGSTKPVQSQPAVPEAPVRKTTGYSGKLLAGNSSPFLEYNRADYEKALKEGKTILLDFYANWCPICRGEEPNLFSGFNSLTEENVIGFRVNYKDSETDQDEKTLADQLKVTYQHTKIILKGGKEFSRSLDSWNQQKFDSEIKSAII